MQERTGTRGRVLTLVVSAVLVAAACSAAATPVPTKAPTAAPPAAATATPAPTARSIGTIEKKSVTLGYRLPSLNSVAALLVATDKGYWKACGLDKVDLIQTEEVNAGVVSGSIDVGILETVDLGASQTRGLPLVMVAGYRPYSRNLIAVRPEIKKPADLAGKDILLGGTPGTADYDVRFGLLKEAGFDLTGIAFNAVTVPGGSDAWVALMQQSKLWLSPVFNRHFQALKDGGFSFWVDRQDFGSDHIGVTSDMLAKNPNTVAAVLCGLIQGIKGWVDPANKDYVLGLGAKAGLQITDAVKNSYIEDSKNYKPYDGGAGPYDQMQSLFDKNVKTGKVDIKKLVDVIALNMAQTFLKLPLTPAP